MTVFIMTAWFVTLLNGLFGSPTEHVKAINDDLLQAQVKLDKRAYDQSYDKVKGAEGEFNYIYNQYPQKQRQTFLEDINQYELAISVFDIKRSQMALKQMQRDWGKMTMK